MIKFAADSGKTSFPLERWQSGRMHWSWKPAYRKVPGVRIPLSPPKKNWKPAFYAGFFYAFMRTKLASVSRKGWKNTNHRRWDGFQDFLERRALKGSFERSEKKSRRNEACLAIWRIFRRSPLSEEKYPNRNPAWNRSLWSFDFQSITKRSSRTSLSEIQVFGSTLRVSWTH